MSLSLVVTAFLIGYFSSIGWVSLTDLDDAAPLVFLPTAALIVLYSLSLRRRITFFSIGTGFAAGALIGDDSSRELLFWGIEALSPMLLVFTLYVYWQRKKRRRLQSTLVFYCIAALFQTILIGFVAQPVFSNSQSALAPPDSTTWALNHLLVYFALSPVLFCLISKWRGSQLDAALERPFESASFILASIGLVLVGHFYGEPEGFAVSLMVLAPFVIVSAFRVRMLVTFSMIALMTLTLGLIVGVPGVFSSAPPDSLRSFLVISFLSCLLMIALISRFVARLHHVERAVSDRNRFIASVGHELRSSLNGLIGAAELLQKDLPSDADKYDRLGLIQRTGLLMSRLVEDALEYSSLGGTQVELTPVPFSLADSANDCAALFRSALESKGVELHVETEKFDEFLIDADHSRISQVIINLLSNASKFTHTGEVVLSLQSQVFDHRRVNCIIEVADTGPGVPDDRKLNIFEAFERSGDSAGGLGLGLAISRDIAKAMEGSLSIADRPGGGSIFKFEFQAPFVQSDKRSATTPRLFDAEGSSQPSVLLAEDNHSSRIVLEAMLRAAGIDVTSVDNGEDAVETACGSQHFDLILMDMNMPKLSGVSAISEIRARNHHSSQTPILVISGNEGDEVVKRLIDVGARGLIVKPLTAERLLAAVNTVLVTKSDQNRFIVD